MSSGLPGDINARIARALASGDAKAAAGLAGDIAAAQASGAASGFDADLAALQKLAGVTVTKASPSHARPLAKSHPDAGWEQRSRDHRTDQLAKAITALPPDLRGRLYQYVGLAKAAQTPQQQKEAEAFAKRLAADIGERSAFTALLGRGCIPRDLLFEAAQS